MSDYNDLSSIVDDIREHRGDYLVSVEVLVEEIHRLREARIRVLALADVAARRGRDLRLIPETRLAGTAYLGMAARIRAAVKGEEPTSAPEESLPN